MQKIGAVDPSSALQILAEVYHQARELWPFSSKDADATVTVRIDALKEMDVAKIFEPEAGHFWVLSKSSSKDAMVVLKPVLDLQSMTWEENRILTFTHKKKNNKAKTAARFNMLFSRSYRGHMARSGSNLTRSGSNLGRSSSTDSNRASKLLGSFTSARKSS